MLACPLDCTFSTILRERARGFTSFQARSKARPTGFEPVTFGFVDCWSFDCHFGGVFPGFAGLSSPEPLAREGLAVVPKDIAGARFVSQGDARILESVAA